MKYHTAVPIGRGGMGEVVRAWDPTLNRYVALKFLRSDDPELEERMLREARAQAKVSHPNVCPVYEVGRHEGRVFIAMQLIEGRPLGEVAANLGPEQKVALVRTVAEAVHAAHSVGLVHRDLKPANILVERTAEGDLKPWVVDFGIAREREVEGATVTGQVLGTPGYLSPEQARGEISTIDRRSDVFSLGVVLYELLAGRRPHPGDSEIEALVSLLQSDPTPLRRWVSHVPRDLETVVMTCLQPERERRYESARALADDLGRYLAGEPIQARPSGVWRRMTIRARRHPATAGLLGAAAVVVAVLTISLAWSWVKYTVDLRRERDRAQQARIEAEQREQEATGVSESLVGLFELADPSRQAGEALTARQLLVKGEQRLERELVGHPLRLARLLNVMASSYLGLGIRHEGERLARRALALRREAAGDGSIEVADSLVTLAKALRSESLRDAEQCYREALDIRRRELGEQDPAVAHVRVRLADLLLARNAIDEAEALNQQAIAVLRAREGGDTGTAFNALDTAGKIRSRRGDFAGAIALYNEMIERRQQSHGPDDPKLASLLNNLAYNQRKAGDLVGAEAHYRAALDLSDRIWGRSHPDRLRVMLNLAAVLDLQHHDAETRELLVEVVELRRALVPAGDWRVGRDLTHGIGRFLMIRQRWDEAELPLREAVAILEKALGAGHPWVALARGQLAACLDGLGRDAEAESLARASLVVLERAETLAGEDAVWVERLVEYFEAAGRPERSARYLRLLQQQDAGAGSPQT